MTSNVQQFPGTKPKASRRTHDWEQVEQDYRAGIKSIAQIAREQGVARSTINAYARRRGWTRDLSARVQQRAKEKLSRETAFDTVVETESGADHALLPAKTGEREIVEIGAEAMVQVVRGHRHDLTRRRRTLSRLHALLETHLQEREARRDGESVSKVASCLADVLGPRETLSDVTLKLIRGLAQLIPLERQAFGLDERDTRAAFRGEALSAKDREILEDYRRAVVQEVMQELAAE